MQRNCVLRESQSYWLSHNINSRSAKSPVVSSILTPQPLFLVPMVTECVAIIVKQMFPSPRHHLTYCTPNIWYHRLILMLHRIILLVVLSSVPTLSIILILSAQVILHPLQWPTPILPASWPLTACRTSRGPPAVDR